MHIIYSIGFILVTYQCMVPYTLILHLTIYEQYIKRVVFTRNLIFLETYLKAVLYYSFD